MVEHEETYWRAVFTGGFGSFFLWHLAMLFGFIPIFGFWIQYLFLKWIARNTVIVPMRFTPQQVEGIMELERAKERVKKEVNKF